MIPGVEWTTVDSFEPFDGSVLASTLTDQEDDEARRRAARRLVSLGPAADPQSGVLAMALKDPDIHVRRHAAEALAGFGPAAAPEAYALATALEDQDAAVREMAAQALRTMGPPSLVADLSLVLMHGPEETKVTARRAAAALGRLGPEQGGVLALELRHTLVQRTLATHGTAASSRLADLIGHERDSDDPKQYETALACLAALGAEATRALVSFLTCHCEEARAGAAAGFEALGLAAGPHVQALAAALSDASHKVRGHAVAALASCGTAAAPAVTKLVAVLGDDDPAVRRQALRALLHCGQDVSPYVASIAPCLRDGNEDVCTLALTILTRLDATVIGPHLEPIAGVIYKLDDPYARMEAADWAADIGAATLSAALVEDRWQYRDFEPSGPAPPPAYCAAPPAGASEELCRAAACREVALLGRACAATLTGAMDGGGKVPKSSGQRRRAAEALATLGPLLPPSERASLLAGLVDEDEGVRRAAASAIHAGIPAPKAKARLRDMSLDDRWGRDCFFQSQLRS